MLSSQRYYGYQNVDAVGNGTYEVPAFDGSGSAFPLTLDVSAIKRPGRYVIVKSTTQLQNYVGTSSVSFVGGTTPLKVRSVTGSGTGDVVKYPDGNSYYCIVVTVA